MRRLLRVVLGLASGGFLHLCSTGAALAQLKVVASIKPIHSLTAAVMAGAGAPHLLIDGAASPHTFVLKPSDARMLNEADVVFRVSDSLEPFMIKTLASLPRKVRVITLADLPGITLYARRTGGTFDEDTVNGDPSAHPHGAGLAAHHDATSDGHLWLDPVNAKLIAKHIADVLGRADPEHAELFRSNYTALAARLDRLSGELEQSLKPIAGRPYVVFHDAYQYLEKRYNLHPVGSVTISPELAPSAKRLASLRRKISALKAACVFAEPEFEPKLTKTVIEGTGARTGTLDGLGAALPPGPDLYFAVMRALVSDLRACLVDPS